MSTRPPRHDCPDDAPREPDFMLVEWALRERLGCAPKPDLVASVRAARSGIVHPGVGRSGIGRSGIGRSGIGRSGVAPSTPSPSATARQPTRRSRTGRQPRRVLPLAAALLGVLVVAALMTRVEPSRDEAAPRQEPASLSILSVDDALAAPIDTRAVHCSYVDDDVIEALTRLRDLEVLVVRELHNESFGLSLKIVRPQPERHVTNAIWRQIAKFTKLRRLVLSGTVRVARIDTGTDSATGNGADVVTALEHLPGLESLSLRYLDTDDDVLRRLSKLRSLRHLDLSFNHGFGDDGVRALLACRSLRTLSLRGCQQVHGDAMACLGELPELEELDLSSIDGINWRNSGALDNAEHEVLRRASFGAGSLAGSVSDETLRGLAESNTLRVLNVAQGRFTPAGIAALGAIDTLRDLDLFGGDPFDPALGEATPTQLERLVVCGDHDDAFCRSLAQRLPNLRELTIAACDRITDAGLRHVLGIDSLRVLDMRQMRGLTVASVDALLAATQVQQFDVRHNGWLDDDDVGRLRAAGPEGRSVTW